MLAVLSSAAISRSWSALAIAGPSFSAVARGRPSIGAIATLLLSRNARIGAPCRGTSSANGCGSGWQLAIDSSEATSPPRSQIGGSNSIAERDCRECAAIHPLATQTGTPITEEIRVIGSCIASRAFDVRYAGASQPALNIARQVKHQIAGSQRGRKMRCAGRVVRQEWMQEFRPDLV